MTDTRSAGTQTHWQVEKKIPIALMIGLALQAFGAVWWASGINGQVVGNTLAINQLATRAEAQRANIQAQAIQLGRIEEQVSGLRTDIGRLIVIIERRSQ